MNIVISSNSSWNLYNFRKNILHLFEKKLNCNFLFLCPDDKYLKNLELKNYTFKKINIKSRKISFITDIILLFQYFIYFLRYKPELYVAFTIKPNIYGTLASRFLSIKTINNFTGLGSLFYKNNLLRILFRVILKLIISKSEFIFFHNKEDLKYISNKKKNISNYKLVPGSGIDLSLYTKQKYNKNYDKNSFLFFGRVMKEKGIREFLNAAKIIVNNYNNVKFGVLGKIEENEKKSMKILNDFHNKKIVKYYGFRFETINIINQYECVILPTYHEGMSKALLESAALYKPILATNISGVKEIVNNNENGYLFEARNTDDLVQKIQKFIDTSDKNKTLMGLKSREKIEKNFDDKLVLLEYSNSIDKIFHQK